jgi:hypothetical protein
MASRSRTRAEVFADLRTQRDVFLANSCEAYDRGNKAAALRLAVVASTLVRDGNKTRSIFTQLGVKETIQYVSSGRASTNPKIHSLLILTDLAITKNEDGTGSAENCPMLDQCIARGTMRIVDFDTWWNKEIIWQSPEKLVLNRRRLVASMRDQDGGAHLDSELTDSDYISSSRENQWWWLEKGQPVAPMTTNQHFATMRQVAWELQKTVEGNADKFLA